MACEIMVATPAIRAMIRDDKIHQILGTMQAGKKFGMLTLNDSLYSLYMQREVTMEECLRHSEDANEFQRMVGEPAANERSGAAPLRAAAGGRR